MAKKRIGQLKGKPIVEGDPNLLKTNELLYRGGQLSKRNKEGNIQDLASNSLGSIYVGLKNPLSHWDADMSALNGTMRDMALGIKFTNASYDYAYMSYLPYENNYFEKEKMLAFAIPAIPEFPFNVLDNPTSVYTFSQLRHIFVTSYGFTEQEFDSTFYEISKEEFFTPFGEYKDVLTLEIDDKELIVDFAARKWFLTGEGWKDIDKDTNTVNVVSLLRLPYQYRSIVYNNVKYETTINNYVVYGRFEGDYTFTNSRVKTNGIGPDPNYPKLDGAEAFMHSSGIQVNIMMQ